MIYARPTFRIEPELPPPYLCAICERTVTADRWRKEMHHPPLCLYCTASEGHQVRIPGMTRGDHHTLQRLHAVASALGRVALWKEKGWH